MPALRNTKHDRTDDIVEVVGDYTGDDPEDIDGYPGFFECKGERHEWTVPDPGEGCGRAFSVITESDT